jgi:hypothetical protein
MISDILYDAVSDIEKYEQENPNCYRDLQVEIAHLKCTMKALASYLDAAMSLPHARVLIFPTPPPPLNCNPCTRGLEKAARKDCFMKSAKPFMKKKKKLERRRWQIPRV